MLGKINEVKFMF